MLGVLRGGGGLRLSSIVIVGRVRLRPFGPSERKDFCCGGDPSALHMVLVYASVSCADSEAAVSLLERAIFERC
jgi:hypothetical protein